MGKKAKLTTKEKAKAKKSGFRDSVKGIKKSLKENQKRGVRQNRARHNEHRLKMGMAVKKISHNKAVGTLPTRSAELVRQGAMSSTELCLQDSVEMLLSQENSTRKAAEAAYEAAKKSDPKGLEQQLITLTRKTKSSGARSMANMLLKDVQKALAEQKPTTREAINTEATEMVDDDHDATDANNTHDEDDISLRKKTKDMKRLLRNL